MKTKTLIANAFVATLLAVAGTTASASTIISQNTVNIGSSFTDVIVGTISIGSLSDLIGSFSAADKISGNFFGTPYTLTLGSVTFTSGTVGSLTGDLDTTNAGFSFKNVASGEYVVKASGNVSGGQVANTSLIGASYTVTPVPEPESFAMMLAGLGLMGAIALRRKQSAS